MLVDKPVARVPLLYIGGYGRSGSTALELAVGRSLNALCSGESSAAFSPNRTVGATHCSCGELPTQCPFWSEIYHKALAGTGYEAYESFNSDSLIVEYEYSKSDMDMRARYSQFWHIVYRESLARTGCAFVVDSSKTARGKSRVLAFFESGLFDLYFIHLKRHPRAVLKSRASGVNIQGGLREAGPLVWPRTVYGLRVANAFAEKVVDTLGIQSCTLNYESLDKTLDDLIVSIADHFGAVEIPSDSGFYEHIVAGNRLVDGAKDRFVLKINVGKGFENPGLFDRLIECATKYRDNL